MVRVVVSTVVLATSLASHGVGATTSVHKCVFNGTVTYQSDPCPSGATRNPPTVEQLNAERQKKLRQAAGTPIATPQSARSSAPLVTHEPKESFTCDGRTHCSQMTSCAQAQYFLARCPGTKMDGDGDGIPCEKQWCR